MNLEDYAAQDAVGLAALIRSRQCSEAEVLRAALVALERTDRRLNCLVATYPDRHDRKGEDGPLKGVPFVYKDAGAHEAGVPQACGSRLAQGVVAQTESELAARFRRAGLVALGRSTTAELTYSSGTESSLHGATRNPWNPDRTPGGSSGGSAVAVAAGAVPLAHATDGGGSIRTPAAWCGLVGLKPSRGRVSWGPDLSEALFGLAAQHVLCRTVRDTAAVLDSVHGYHSGDPFTIPGPSRPFLDEVGAPPGRLRIGLVTESWTGGWPVDPECAEATRRAAALLADQGHAVEVARIRIDADAFLLATAQTSCSQLAVWIDALAAGTGRDPEHHLDAAIHACYRYGQGLTAAQLNVALMIFNGVCRAVGATFDAFDVLLTPTTAVTAPAIGVLDPAKHPGPAVEWTAHMYGPASMTATFNTTGHPAVSLPLAQHSNGMPIGVQLVARHAEEATLLRLAAFFEQAMPWSGRRPPHWLGGAPD